MEQEGPPRDARPALSVAQKSAGGPAKSRHIACSLALERAAHTHMHTQYSIYSRLFLLLRPSPSTYIQNMLFLKVKTF